ncbi:CsbD family protein [Arenimonas aestuarii]
MGKTSYPSRRGGHSRGGFNSPSRIAGFLGSLKSLFWPEMGLPVVPPRVLPEAEGGRYRTLPGMPRAASTGTAPKADSPGTHSLRRVAGSAGRWRNRLGEARQTWPLAGVDELIATDGHLHKLVALVELRYGISHEAAERQVREFLGPHDAGA